MSEHTGRLGLPLIQTGQAQKEVTHNAALHRIDRCIGLRVRSRNLPNAPEAPQPGDTWIVAADGQDVWHSKDGLLAEWDGEQWTFRAAPDGVTAWVEDEDAFIARSAGQWRRGLPVAGLVIGGREVLAAEPSEVAQPHGGAVVDVEARTAIAALLTGLRGMGLVA